MHLIVSEHFFKQKKGWQAILSVSLGVIIHTSLLLANSAFETQAKGHLCHKEGKPPMNARLRLKTF